MTSHLGLRRLFILLAGLGFLAGIWTGLARLGLLTAPTVPDPARHGALMVSGFLGTLISLERAVGVGLPAGYLIPLLAGAGSLALVLGVPAPAPQLLGLAAAVGLVGLYLRALSRHPDDGLAIMGLGAVLWAGGNVSWWLGRGLAQAADWWAGFLVLTIMGERLELSRVAARPPVAGRLLGLITATLMGGLGLGLLVPEAGHRLSGLALAAMALWLLKYDVAWVTVRRPGQVRFIATCLLLGFFWLGVGGLWWALGPYVLAGPAYDGGLHAIFLGFVMSMIFGHALIILPAVAAVPFPFHPVLYVPLVLLHASLTARIAGDLAGLSGLRGFGGLFNAVATLLFFLLAVVRSVTAKSNAKT